MIFCISFIFVVVGCLFCFELMPGVLHRAFLQISYSRHMVSPTFAHTHPTPPNTHPCPSSTIQLGVLSVDLHPCSHPSVSCCGRCSSGTAARWEVSCHHYDRVQRPPNQMWRFGSRCVGVELSQAAGPFGDFPGPVSIYQLLHLVSCGKYLPPGREMCISCHF